jgi:hypothetical protein
VLADELVDLPERHVDRPVIAQAGQGQTAEQNVENERPVIAHRHRDQAEGPQEVGDVGWLGLDDLPDLVDLVGKGRMSDADT